MFGQIEMSNLKLWRIKKKKKEEKKKFQQNQIQGTTFFISIHK